MSRALPLALTQQRRRVRAAPVSLAEMDTCRALERQGVPHELVLRVVIPLARAVHLSHPRRNTP